MRTLPLFALSLALAVTSGCGGDSAETAAPETTTGETTAPTTDPAPTTPAGPQNHSGTLAAGDQQLDSGEFADPYTVEVTSGQRIVVDMNSTEVDPYLILRAPSGSQVDNDDHEGSTTHSRIEHTATETGTYTVLATVYTPGETGAYTVTIATQ